MDNNSEPRPAASPGTIKTTILILSDTHGMALGEHPPFPRADVAIHCGDLTEESKLAEMRTTLGLLKQTNAPLKLVIPGNHDFTLDTPSFRHKEYGDYGEAEQLFRGAREAHGVRLLGEGTHRLALGNGAALTVYASPYTPSLGDWGFQYRPDRGHAYGIGEGADVVVTHGPPRGVLDRTGGRERGGSAELFAAVAAARPRVHCFGHIHEGWGAKLVTWRDGGAQQGQDREPSHLTGIDNGRSHVVETLGTILPGRHDTPEDVALKEARRVRYRSQGYCSTSHCRDDEFPLEVGRQTLFVNAAVKGGDEELPVQFPWLVTLELPQSEATNTLKVKPSSKEVC
ncbi:hypothetical protein KVR01_013422 [Diaporthe batatas]|uniref:uncharacterized protein n=1 Tax=Diaporthe batatas TaxID=748121 RepID=UPI001D03735A|nr:uncharacterized protein KVR01_013422 [Diaporthe batatas]KAG8156817.1 hypothetical protein KVR01_013422 [Diaporthe batatas]